MTIDATALQAAGDNIINVMRSSPKSDVQGTTFIHSSITSCLLNNVAYPDPTLAQSRVESELAAFKTYINAVNSAITA